MTNTAVRASEILLRKVSPDMIATALSIQDSAKLPLLTIIPRDSAPPVLIEHDASGSKPIDSVDLPVTHKDNAPHSSTKSAA